MKKTCRQIMKIVNHLSDEIRWRYPNLYQSLSENRVHRILEDMLENSEYSGMERSSMRDSSYTNRKGVA